MDLYWLDIALVVAGFIVLVIGYRRNDRKLLLTAALLLFLTGTLSSFSRGFADGLKQAGSYASHESLGPINASTLAFPR